MRAGWTIVAAVAAVLAVSVAAGCGDDPDQIEAGVRVAGIEIGGMHSADARRKLAKELDKSTRRRLTAAYGKQKVELPRPHPPLKVDVDALVDKALAAAADARVSVRDGIRGTSAAVDPLVKRVKDALDRPPRDATVSAGAGGVNELTSRDGLSVDGRQLGASILSVMLSPNRPSRVDVPARPLSPEVTTAELAKKYPRLISIDRANFKLRLYKDLKLTKSYTVAVGAAGYDTPTGRYQVQDKQVDPTWSVPNSPWAGDLGGSVVPPGPANPLKARWIGFAGAAGIHGTDDAGSLGSAASHGCIRMAVDDVIDLYDRVRVGTPIFVD